MNVSISADTIMQWLAILAIFSVMNSVGNWIGFQSPLNEALMGMIILSIISLTGLVLEKILPWNMPSILYISIIGLIIAVPWSPISQQVIYYTSQIDIVSLTTILLAYAGIAMGKDIRDFKKVGLRGVIVTFFVIMGTYLGSAIIAQEVLVYTGII